MRAEAVDSKFCTQVVAEVPGAPPFPGIVSVTVRSPVGSLKVMAMARHGQISSPTELLAICHQALSQKTHVKPRPAQYSKSMKKNELCKSQVLKIFGKVARSMQSICDTAQEMSRGAPCGQLDQLGLPLFKSHCLKSHMSHMSARICKPQTAIQCNPAQSNTMHLPYPRQILSMLSATAATAVCASAYWTSTYVNSTPCVLPAISL